MTRKISYIIAIGAALALTSCGKKLSQFSADYFTVNPNPLEVVGENVPSTVSARIPEKFFLRNAEVTVTPLLVFNGTEVAAPAYTFQGEKVRGNAPVISYENGGNVSIPVNFVYQPEMAVSELQLDFAVTQGNKQYVLPRVTVATGVIATASLASVKSAAPAYAPDAFQRVINNRYTANIMFLINQANIRASELNTDAMVELRNLIIAAAGDSSQVIRELNIQSYASPDGGIDVNERLASQRESATTSYLRDQLAKDKITEFGELTSQFTAEDWEGFQLLVAQSNIQDKDLILSVLSMYKDPEQREREIRNLSNVFEQLADEILPQLRYSRITASIDVIGRSDEEIMALATSDPKQLSVEELLYAGTLTDDLATRLAIYETAARQYPQDYRCWNNLGAAQFAAGNYDGAQSSIRKATSLNGTAAEPQMNAGLCQLAEGNYSKAHQLFGGAAGLNELNDALGLFYLKTGDNAAAARAFGNSKSNNAALAQILTKDYSKARQTLAGIDNPDATTYYLMAVLGARTNNEQMLTTNLRQAVRLDSSLADRARQDLEFAGFNLSRALN